MGRKSKWFGAVKKAFTAESKKKSKLRRKSETESTTSAELEVVPGPSTPPQAESVRPAETEREKALLDERRSAWLALSGEKKDAAAAIRVQTAWRRYLARRTLHALKGVVRLNTLIHGQSVKRQAATTLRCMQTLAKVQSQIQTRRIRMSEENQALQRQLLLKNETELERLRMSDRWDDSAQSKEQIEASLSNKQEAALRRERQLAYAFSHQWKNSSKSALFMDPRNPHWGWSWLERWMAARPSEARSIAVRDPSGEHGSVKNTGVSAGGEIASAHGQHDTNSEKPSPVDQKPRLPSSQSPRILTSKAPSLTGRVVKPASPGSCWSQPKDSSTNTASIPSESNLTQSLVTPSTKDDESLEGLPSLRIVPSYMVPTKSAKAKSRLQSVLPEPSVEKSYAGSPNVGSMKKRLSFPLGAKPAMTSPAEVRRHSGPPKMAIATMKDSSIAVGE